MSGIYKYKSGNQKCKKIKEKKLKYTIQSSGFCQNGEGNTMTWETEE